MPIFIEFFGDFMSKEQSKALTVTQLTEKIRGNVEHIGLVWLTGEISGLKCHTSGHIYLTIKDGENQIAAIVWRRVAKKLATDLKDGIEVLVSGEISVYGPQSKYQIYVKSIEPRGAGALLIAFENLKKKLSAEGLFDRKRKKTLPKMPKKICIVTSPTGAAVQDILNVINRRFSALEILIYPVRVQGDQASKEIADAIEFINTSSELCDVETLIVGRGGGSPEDLWAFNEEIVARAIFRSKIPVISAVGHEIDFTISDYVADRRALTPSEAGELAVPRYDQVLRDLKTKERQLHLSMMNKLHLAKSNVNRLGSSRCFTKPQDRIDQYYQTLDILEQRMKNCVTKFVKDKHIVISQLYGQLVAQRPSNRVIRYQEHLESLRSRLHTAMNKRLELEKNKMKGLSAHIEALSPLGILSRGYSITYTEKGEEVVKSSKQVEPGEYIWSKFSDSWILSQVVKKV